MTNYLQAACDRMLIYRERTKLTEAERETITALHQKLDNRIFVIAAVGLTSRGKTSVLNALAGKRLWDTGATNGVTKSLVSSQLPAISASAPKIQLQLIDTPGLDEIDGEKSTEMAKAIGIKISGQADLILFVIAGDMNRLEQEMLMELHSCSKPVVLVFNKIDLYPECDRDQIHAAIADEAARQLISANEIVLTAAEPKSERVRIQYANQSAPTLGLNEAEEIWEQPEPQINDLKIKILDILNQSGKELLALNAMLALSQIQQSVTQRYVEQLPPLRSAATIIFAIKAIALLLSPFVWTDAAIGAAIDSMVFVFWLRGQDLIEFRLLWIGAIANSVFLAVLGLESNLVQIAWAGITAPWFLQWLQIELERRSDLGKYGAKTLIQQIYQQAPVGSMLNRILSP